MSALRNNLMLARTLAAATVLCGLLLVAPPARAEISESDQKLVQDVWARLLAVAEPPEGFAWPPTIEIVENKDCNAYATIRPSKEGDDPNLRYPISVVFTGMLDQIIQGDPDRLAFILGHELSHITCGHVVTPSTGKPKFIEIVYTRIDENEADVEGAKLMVKAGYSLPRGIKGIQRIIELGLEYTSFEGLSVDHPSWKDRLVLIDGEQSKIWKSMSAFENGNIFLATENYPMAESCFRFVIKDFPNCYEAWANLGYALLMQYCDGLEEEDLRSFAVGQILVGGFYSRPNSLSAGLRGPDSEVWFEAIGALREALRLKPDLTLAKANLGVAYLVCPDGKDVGNATRFLTEAASDAMKDDSLDPLMRAAILLNAGVVDLAGGNATDGESKFTEVEKLGKELPGGRPATTTALATALQYNRATMLMASPNVDQRRRALDEWELYLRSATPASAWWALGYDSYAKLCKELNATPKTKDELQKAGKESFRLVVSVPLASGETIDLGNPVQAELAKLGEPETLPIAPRRGKLMRYRYNDLGLEVLGLEDVIAVRLSGPNAPELPLRGSGLTGGKKSIKIGMTKDDLEKLLAGQDYDFRELDDPEKSYRFYRNLGLAVRIEGGKVVELVVAQIPQRDRQT
ncbi:MAG: M48 family metalloprotease [Pirellulales bacterium]|nr:M48 family metalloprotease [Pirellulales bacterium]